MGRVKISPSGAPKAVAPPCEALVEDGVACEIQCRFSVRGAFVAEESPVPTPQKRSITNRQPRRFGRCKRCTHSHRAPCVLLGAGCFDVFEAIQTQDEHPCCAFWQWVRNPFFYWLYPRGEAIRFRFRFQEHSDGKKL